MKPLMMREAELTDFRSTEGGKPMKRGISIIAAIAKNGAIGKGGVLPWPPFREDFAHFKRTTLGNVVIMGRRTWESLPKRPLPDRLNFVVSNTMLPSPPASAFSSLTAALLMAGMYSKRQAFIIGGARLYAEALPLADRLYLTEVDVEVPDADTWWRPDLTAFREAERRKGETRELTFVTYEREI